MSKGYKTLADIPRQKLQALASDPRFKQRFLLFNILPLFFALTSIAFLVMIVLGVFPPAEAQEASPIWPVLPATGFFEVPALFFVVGKMLKPVREAQTLSEAATRGGTPIILALAMSESICIYALIGPFLDMPQIAQIGLWAFGFVVLIASQVWVRGKVRGAMLLGLAKDLAAEAD